MQPDLVDYFAEEVTTLPPDIAHAAVSKTSHWNRGNLGA
jgi:hypothetical protein